MTSFITIGERQALMTALAEGGDQGFLAAAQAAGLVEWRLAWELTVDARRVLRCIDCGRWVGHYAMSKAGDICLACEAEYPTVSHVIPNYPKEQQHVNPRRL